jgi:putative salt-induced outer membrane protein
MKASRLAERPHTTHPANSVKTNVWRKMGVLVASVLVCNISLAVASDPTKPWQGDVEAGLIMTEGNTSAKSLKTGLKGAYKADRWRHTGAFESFTAEQENKGTAEKYYAEAKSGYSFTEFNYGFIYGNYTDDRFTDFDFQTSASAGYGRLFFDNATHRWDAEIGPGHRVTRYEDGDYTQETIAHAATNYTWNISQTSRFEQTVLVEGGSTNTVTRSKSALIAKINSSFSMKLGYTITYNQKVPDVVDAPETEDDTTESSEHADKETTVSLLYSF